MTDNVCECATSTSGRKEQMLIFDSTTFFHTVSKAGQNSVTLQLLLMTHGNFWYVFAIHDVIIASCLLAVKRYIASVPIPLSFTPLLRSEKVSLWAAKMVTLCHHYNWGGGGIDQVVVVYHSPGQDMISRFLTSSPKCMSETHPATRYV